MTGRPYRVAWVTPLPRLTVELVRSCEPSNCVHNAVYRVTSSPFPLTDEQIAALDKIGVLGGGQTLKITDRFASKVAAGARGYDREGFVVEANPVEEHGRSYPPVEFDVYTYVVERMEDSGD